MVTSLCEVVSMCTSASPPPTTKAAWFKGWAVKFSPYNISLGGSTLLKPLRKYHIGVLEKKCAKWGNEGKDSEILSPGPSVTASYWEQEVARNTWEATAAFIFSKVFSKICHPCSSGIHDPQWDQVVVSHKHAINDIVKSYKNKKSTPERISGHLKIYRGIGWWKRTSWLYISRE